MKFKVGDIVRHTNNNDILIILDENILNPKNGEYASQRARVIFNGRNNYRAGYEYEAYICLLVHLTPLEKAML